MVPGCEDRSGNLRLPENQARHLQLIPCAGRWENLHHERGRTDDRPKGGTAVRSPRRESPQRLHPEFAGDFGRSNLHAHRPEFVLYWQKTKLILLEGKVAVITGSGRGIGRATAELFTREGARVVINDLDEEPLRA